MNFLRMSILWVICLIIPGSLFAQKEDIASVLWKKRIGQIIYTHDTLDEQGHVHRKEYGDTLLAKALIEAVIDRKVKSYKFSSSSFKDTLDIKNFMNFINYDDTLYYGDSVSVIHHSIQLKDVVYKITEDWIFNSIDKETEIKIIGITVGRKWYNDAGEYIGLQAMFRIKWDDAKSIINQFMRNHPENNIQSYLWNNYFKRLSIDSQNTIKPKFKKGWTRYAVTDVEIKDESSDPIYGDPIYGMEFDGRYTIAQSFYDSIQKEKLHAYRDLISTSNVIFPFDSIAIEPKSDTTIIIDDRPSPDDSVIIAIWDINWNDFNNYDILEQWDFNPEEGKTKIKLVGIRPRFDKTTSTHVKKVRNLFWVRYEDVAPIIHSYDEYHPLNNLSTALWKSYFTEEQDK